MACNRPSHHVTYFLYRNGKTQSKITKWPSLRPLELNKNLVMWPQLQKAYRLGFSTFGWKTAVTRVNWFVNYRGADQSNTTDHSGFAVPSIPVLKGKFGSQNSLQASGSHGSLSDLSQTDSNPDLSSSARKLSNQSVPDQHTPRRGSASSGVSDKYELFFFVMLIIVFVIEAITPFLVSPVGCAP